MHNTVKPGALLRGAVCLFFAALLLFSFSVSAFEVPALASRVNDYAGVISTDTKGKLEALLKDYETKTGTQFFVLTVDSIQDAGTIEQYGISVADKWKAGKKKEDNGLILIVAVKDRKVRFEVGYGLEGKLPDVVAFRIIREKIVPAFRDGDYSLGVASGVVYAIKSIGGYDMGGTSDGDTAGASAGVAGGDSSGNGKLKKSELFRILVIIIFFAASIVFRFIFGLGGLVGGRRRHVGGFWGGFGGFGGGSSGGFGGGFGGGGGGGFGGGGASGSW
jgi:uncharacterized protein